ncbi:LOW QUALITY PROTEIN: isoamyl alcohol oxidase [Colletotrichum navitas]|uniref:Isoamyl alcohol oxidase n=1 Tax=Colletotrichum navitas TaxID=681940 RepID=A0AAD8PZ00_9PEZI|nr:LOW QUALITY PROTEIN: isoamyl alcohol oxidase [Colletotrichum navitas]KAK1590714.1 LOW QUALITY PROTEIN: isoamyl alcohol oxidase [Colletotrichum navitas]
MEVAFTAYIALFALLPFASCQCKCTPGDLFWPSDKEWGRLNSSVSGRLIRAVPPAAPCYTGPARDAAVCEAVTQGWQSTLFQAAQPIGYVYPLNLSCPLVPFTANASSATCTIGNSPVYVVNATSEEDIAKAVEFARDHNIRLAIKATGHDFLQRSTGYGSLSIWLQHFRQGLNFHDDFQAVNECPKSDWTGSALTITGAYSWAEVNPAAFEKNLIVVSGNNEGPSSTGGWTQGGGHSRVTRYYGLGAQQVLSARVILASGDVVVANLCNNTDLLYAIRGGGGGTYGVLTIKTYPTKNTNVITVTVGAASVNADSSARFLDAMTDIYSSFPYLSQVGFGGYGSWALNASTALGSGNFTTFYTQSFVNLGKDPSETTQLFAPFAAKIKPLSDAGFAVSITQEAFPDFGSYYTKNSGELGSAGGVSTLSSRLLGKSALETPWAELRQVMETVAGADGKAVYHTLVHHGLEVSPVMRDETTAVQPGWYDSIILDISERPIFAEATEVELFADMRQNIAPVYQKLSPNTGTYMNEADWGDIDYRENFYATNWGPLSNIKTKYDPDGVFYCQTCVGSDEWKVDAKGALCRRDD